MHTDTHTHTFTAFTTLLLIKSLQCSDGGTLFYYVGLGLVAWQWSLYSCQGMAVFEEWSTLTRSIWSLLTAGSPEMADASSFRHPNQAATHWISNEFCTLIINVLGSAIAAYRNVQVLAGTLWKDSKARGTRSKSKSRKTAIECSRMHHLLS